MAVKNLVVTIVIILVFLVFAFFFIGFNLNSGIDLFNKSKKEYNNITNMSWPWILGIARNRKKSSATISTLVGFILVVVVILVIILMSTHLAGIAKGGNYFIAHNLSNTSYFP
jgi:hypothetical protein